MGEQNLEDESRYVVVINHEEQYSIWPAGREIPLGWRAAGKAGTKAECLAYIEEVWTDMRPLSLREAMKKQAENPRPAEPETGHPAPPDPRDDLVAFLSQGDHPVQATAQSVEQFIERIKAGYVNIRFTDTRGGTEIGVRLDTASSNPAVPDIGPHKGTVHIAGNLTLNYRPVRLVADVALDTLTGSGRLQAQPSGA
jgi:uncharacterized protein YbdZ (MbtH family)